MNKKEFREKAKKKGTLKGFTFFGGKFLVFIGRKNDKIVDLTIHSYFFRVLSFYWAPNGWRLATTKPYRPDGEKGSTYYVPRNLLWYCKDLAVWPAPNTSQKFNYKAEDD